MLKPKPEDWCEYSKLNDSKAWLNATTASMSQGDLEEQFILSPGFACGKAEAWLNASKASMSQGEMR